MSTRRTHLARGARLGLPVLALLGLGLAGCSDPASVEPAAPVPAPSAPASPAPSSPAGAPTVDPGTGSSGSDGLTVRYLDGGTVKTVRVEDFPR